MYIVHVQYHVHVHVQYHVHVHVQHKQVRYVRVHVVHVQYHVHVVHLQYIAIKWQLYITKTALRM